MWVEKGPVVLRQSGSHSATGPFLWCLNGSGCPLSFSSSEISSSGRRGLVRGVNRMPGELAVACTMILGSNWHIDASGCCQHPWVALFRLWKHTFTFSGTALGWLGMLTLPAYLWWPASSSLLVQCSSYFPNRAITRVFKSCIVL